MSVDAIRVDEQLDGVVLRRDGCADEHGQAKIEGGIVAASGAGMLVGPSEAKRYEAADGAAQKRPKLLLTCNDGDYTHEYTHNWRLHIMGLHDLMCNEN